MKLHEIFKQKAVPATSHRKFKNIKIKEWLDRYGIKNYIVRPDGVVDVEGDVFISSDLEEDVLPIQFGKVTGFF